MNKRYDWRIDDSRRRESKDLDEIRNGPHTQKTDRTTARQKANHNEIKRHTIRI